MICDWCMYHYEEIEMHCQHQCNACFNNGFRTKCNCQDKPIRTIRGSSP